MTNKLINNDNEINNIFDNIKDLVINSRNKVYLFHLPIKHDIMLECMVE